MRRSPWMKISLPLALIAMLALFVSPVLALECCCQTAVRAQAATVQANSHSCCEKAPAQPAHCAENIESSPSPHGATLGKVCRCAQLTAQPFTTGSQQVFNSGTVLLAVPVQRFHLAIPATSDNPLGSEVLLTRPSPPDLARASGRAPPAFALS